MLPFLQGQLCEEISEKESEIISGGKVAVTQKYPSDGDDSSKVEVL
ncbi:MAG: microviridin/marinostatin family tricyclic proteinase inhibitor [Nostoc sp.]